MAHDAFVSYSTKDKTTADAVCATLEANGIRCWIAPRDVLPGMNWAGAIVNAIHNSRILVLVFSAHSNSSPQVMQEVERAASSGVAILPFRIEEVIPSEAMEYFLGSRHWLDAMTPPMEQHLQHLATTVRLVMEQLAAPAEGAAAGPAPRPNLVGTGGNQPATTSEAAPPASSQAAHASQPFSWKSLLSRSIRWVAAGALVALVAVAITFGLRRATAGPSLTPIQLYNALLASPIVERDLPPGFSSPRTPLAQAQNLSQRDKEYHAISEVQYEVTGPEGRSVASYRLFPTDTDARGAFDGYSAAPTPTDLNLPVKCISGNGIVENQRYGYTDCFALAGNVYLLSASNVLGDSQTKGNLSTATSLLRLELAHLQKVRSSPPRPLSNAPPTGPAPAPTPLAQLPATVRVQGEDVGSREKVAEAAADLRAVVPALVTDYGLEARRRWTVHLYTDQAVARQQMKQFGLDAITIDDFFSKKQELFNQSSGDAQDSILYLPDLHDMRGTLGFLAASYTLHNNGAIDNEDVYPWWFVRGLELHAESRFSEIGFTYRGIAVADARAGTGIAPPLASISKFKDVQDVSVREAKVAGRLDSKGYATLDYLALRYGEEAVGRLVRGNSLGTIQKFNDQLPKVVGMTVDQLNTAVDDALRAPDIPPIVTPVPLAGRKCADWSGTWNSTFGPLRLSVAGNVVTGTYTDNANNLAEGRLQGTISGSTLNGAWSESPATGDLEFILLAGGGGFGGRWRNGSSGAWYPWSGTCSSGS